jgi:CHAT domain
MVSSKGSIGFIDRYIQKIGHPGSNSVFVSLQLVIYLQAIATQLGWIPSKIKELLNDLEDENRGMFKLSNSSPTLALQSLSWLAFCVLAFSCNGATCQQVSEAPRAEYYVARDLFETGRLLEASEGFRISAARSLSVDNKAWIDSIPPLVMQGECMRLQGKIAQAMGLYDSAVKIFLEHQGWINQIQFNAESLPAIETKSKAITWHTSTRRTQTAMRPEPGLLTVDLGQPQAGAGQPMAMVTRVDAAEVLRTIGLAIYRRGEALGPLAKHLSQPLNDALGRNINQSIPWLKNSWTTLRGLHILSSSISDDAAKLIRNSATINNEFDYYLTPLALLRLGKYHWQKGDVVTAITYFQEASVASAKMDQFMILGESLQLLSGACTAGNRADLLPSIQSAANWGNKRSPCIQAFGFGGAAELAVASGSLAAGDNNCKQVMNSFRAMDAPIPLAQVQLQYAIAMLAFSENRRSLGQQHLDTLFKIMHGDAQDTASPRIFQTQQTLLWLQENILVGPDADGLLSELLNEPTEYDWQSSPVETLAAVTVPKIPAHAIWLDLAVRAGSKPHMVERMDRLLRQRFFEALPLGGRHFSWRAAVLGQTDRLSEGQKQVVTDSVQSEPSLSDALQKTTAAIQAIRQLPIPIDERRIGPDAKKRYQELGKSVDIVENQLMRLSMKRKPLDRFLPFRSDVKFIQESLDEDDMMIGFVAVNGKLYGACLTKNSLEAWIVDEQLTIQETIGDLLSEIGLPTNAGPSPTEVTAAGAKWKQSIAKLHKKLFPASLSAKIAKADRILVVPDGPLWYLPFELLPESERDDAEPWLARHSVVYLPTLGSAPLAYAKTPKVKESLCVVGNYFAVDKPTNELFLEAFFNATSKMHRVDHAGRRDPSATHGLRIHLDQVLVASKVEAATKIWETNIMQCDNSRFSQLASWMETPRQTPVRMMLPAYQSLAAKGQVGDGQEIFVPSCGFLYSGTRHLLLSRWNTGGRSSEMLLARFFQELERESPSVAWQRSVVALWAEEILIADEPILLPAGKDLAALTSGMHPKLWSGFMIIGDTCR